MKKIWPFSFYFLYFAALVSIAPYIVLYYQTLQFNGAQIGLLGGVPPLVTLVFAPYLTGIADSTQRHRTIMGLGLAVCFIVLAILPSLASFAVVFVMSILFYAFFAPVSPLADSVTMSMLGDEKEMYGRIRVGGTIGWGVFALVSGLMLDLYGVRSLFYLAATLILVNLFVTQKLSFSKLNEKLESAGSMRALLTSRLWIFFLLVSFLGGMGIITEEIFFVPYMQELGASGNQIGFALIFATITEFLIFVVGDRLIGRFGAYKLLVFSLVLTGLRALLYVAVNTVFSAFLIQALSGTIYPILWVAGVAYADEHAPASLKSTGQGLFNAMVFGFGSAVGGFVGGVLLESMGGKGMFLVMGIITFIGLGIVELLRQLFPVSKERVPEIT